MSHRIFMVRSVAFVNWLLALGNGGAASNAKNASERPRNEAARLDALLCRLGTQERTQSAA